jgi:hydrogenase-4 membrane subunit HyfE
MKSAGWMAITIAAVAAGGLAVCKAMGIDPHLRELIVAAIGMTIVCAVAWLPLLLTRGANQLAVAQAGLSSCGIHLMGSVLVASAMFMRGLLATYPLLIWVAAFFATTLITLTIIIAQHVRKASAAANPTANTASNHA